MGHIRAALQRSLLPGKCRSTHPPPIVHEVLAATKDQYQVSTCQTPYLAKSDQCRNALHFELRMCAVGMVWIALPSDSRVNQSVLAYLPNQAITHALRSTSHFNTTAFSSCLKCSVSTGLACTQSGHQSAVTQTSSCVGCAARAPVNSRSNSVGDGTSTSRYEAEADTCQ